MLYALCGIVALTVHLKINEQKTRLLFGVGANGIRHQTASRRYVPPNQTSVILLHIHIRFARRHVIRCNNNKKKKTPSQTFFRVTNFLFVTFSLLFSWIRTKLTTRKMYTKIQRNLLHPCQHIKISSILQACAVLPERCSLQLQSYCCQMIQLSLIVSTTTTTTV